MSIGPPAGGWRVHFLEPPDSLGGCLGRDPLVAVLFANVVEIPGTEPCLRQGAAGSLLVVAATALLGSTTATDGTGLVRCRRKTSMWGGCQQ
jgi:hypothetical protein